MGANRMFDQTALLPGTTDPRTGAGRRSRDLLAVVLVTLVVGSSCFAGVTGLVLTLAAVVGACAALALSSWTRQA